MAIFSINNGGCWVGLAGFDRIFWDARYLLKNAFATF